MYTYMCMCALMNCLQYAYSIQCRYKRLLLWRVCIVFPYYLFCYFRLPLVEGRFEFGGEIFPHFVQFIYTWSIVHQIKEQYYISWRFHLKFWSHGGRSHLTYVLTCQQLSLHVLQHKPLMTIDMIQFPNMTANQFHNLPKYIWIHKMHVHCTAELAVPVRVHVTMIRGYMCTNQIHVLFLCNQPERYTRGI